MRQLSLAFILCVLTAKSDGIAHAAHFWLSDKAAVNGSSPSPQTSANTPHVRHNPSEGGGSLFLWGRPDAGKTLSGWSLRVVSTNPAVALLSTSDVSAYNPPIGRTSGGVAKNIHRWEFPNSSRPEEPIGEINYIEYTDDEPTGSVLESVQGFSIGGQHELQRGVGIGAQGAGGVYADRFAYNSGSWLLARIDYQLTGAPGTADVFLQIGEAGVLYKNQPLGGTEVRFGAWNDPALRYPSVALSIPDERFIKSATREALIEVGSFTIPPTGDFNYDGVVDGGDFLAWQSGLGTQRASRRHGDGDRNGIVNGQDLAVWKQRIGASLLAQPTMDMVPEPDGLIIVFACMFSMLIGTYRENPRLLRKRVAKVHRVQADCRLPHFASVAFCRLVISVVAASMTWASASRADLWWDGGSGTWGNLSNWSRDADALTPDPQPQHLTDNNYIFNVNGRNQNQVISLSSNAFPSNNRTTNTLLFQSTGSTTITPGSDNTLLTINGGGTGIEVASTSGVVTIQSRIRIGNTGDGSQHWQVRSGRSLIVTNEVNLFGNELIVTGTGYTELNGIVSNGKLIKSDGGALSLSNANTFAGGIDIGGGILVVQADANLGSGPLRFANPGDGGDALYLNGSFATGRPMILDDTVNSAIINTQGHHLIWDGTISGGGGLTKINAGILEFRSTNKTYGGTTKVLGGLLIGSTGVIPGNVENSATTRFHQDVNGSFAGHMSGAGVYEKTGGGEATFTNAGNNYTGPLNIHGGAVQGTTNTIRGNGVNLSNGSSIIFNQDFSGQYDQIISGTGNVTKRGSGILVLTRANTYNGITSVEGGIIQGTTSTIRGPIVIATNTQVNFNQGFADVYGSQISGGGHLSISGGGLVNLNASNSFSGGLSLINSGLEAHAGTVGSGLISMDGGTWTVTTSAPVLNPLQLVSTGGTINTAQSVELQGAISGGGKLTKGGGGSITLTGSNTYTGGTVLNAGNLFAKNGSLGSGRFNFNGGTLFTSHTSAGGNPFSSDVPFTINAPRGTIDTYGNSATLNGIVSGTGALHKTGFGTLVLNGANDYTGGTEISLHVLEGNTSSIKGNITFIPGAEANEKRVRFNQNSNAVFAHTITGDGSFTKTGVGDLELTATNNYSRGTSVAEGTLTGHVGSFGGGPIDIASGATLAVRQPSNGSLNQNIAGQGRVTKTGAGGLTLGGVSSYQGGTFINEGAIFYSQPSNLGSGGVTFNGGTLVPTAAAFGANLMLDRSMALSAGGGTINSNTHSLDLSGAISGAGGLRKIGAGTLTFSGATANSYAGATIVDQGTLVLGKPSGDSGNGFGSAVGDLTINSGATVRLAQHGQIRNHATVNVNGGTLDLGTYTEDAQHFVLNNGTVTGGPGSILYPFGTGEGITSSGTSAINTTAILFADGIHVSSDTLTINGAVAHDPRANLGITKTGPGALKLNGSNTYLGTTAINEGKVYVNGSIASSVVVSANGALGGGGTIGGNVTSDGRVAPGNSPGILTINGDYTQTANSVLDIEVGALTPGPGPIGNPDAGHDQVIVTGDATLAGRFEFPIINGFMPSLNDEITFLQADSISGKPSSIISPNLKAITPPGADELAVRVFKTTSGADEILKMRFVNPYSGLQFVDTTDTEWSDPTSWLDGATQRVPIEEDVVTVANQHIVGDPQTVNVLTDNAYTHQLTVADSTSKITVAVHPGLSLSAAAGGVTIGKNGAIDVNDGTLASGGGIAVQRGGALSADGFVVGSVTVGGGAPGPMATITPGSSTANLAIDGAYSQTSSGELVIDVNSSAPTIVDAGTIDVTGAAALGGKLVVEIADDSAIEVGTVITVMNAGSLAAGSAFEDAVTRGSDEFRFVPRYRGTSATVANVGEFTTTSVVAPPGFDVTAHPVGDMNLDKAFNIADAGDLALAFVNPKAYRDNHFGTSPKIMGRMNSDDFFDYDDITWFRNKLGISESAMAAYLSAAQGVPEPNGLALAAIAFFAAAGRFRGATGRKSPDAKRRAA